MATYVTPGLYYESVDTRRTGITAIRTDIAAFIGIAERGPLHAPTQINSWEQFRGLFGGFIPNGYLAYAVKAFFENGGRTCFALRVAAPPVSTAAQGAQPADRLSSMVNSAAGFAGGSVATVWQDASTQTTAAVQPADRASSIVASVVGFPPHALVTISQPPLEIRRFVRGVERDPNPAVLSGRLYWDAPLDGFNLAAPITLRTRIQRDRLVESVDSGAGTLAWKRPLEPEFDLGKPLQFESGASSAFETLLDQNGDPILRVSAASPGAWGNQLAVRVTRASDAATRTRAGTQPSNGSASRVESVIGFPVASLVRAFQDLPAPVTEFRCVRAVNVEDNVLVWDSPLIPAFDIAQPISFETLEFGLSVYERGRLAEVFNGLSLLAKGDSTRYAIDAVAAGSHLIRIEDLSPAQTCHDLMPDPQSPNLRRGALRLRGGRDGIAGLRMQDFTGDPSSARREGLRLFELEDAPAIMAVPDVLIEPFLEVEYAPPVVPVPDPCLPGEPPPMPAEPAPPIMIERAPTFRPEEVAAVQQALVRHCEVRRDRFAVLEPPRLRLNASAELAAVQSWRARFDTKQAALYYPWILVTDPLRTGGSLVRAVPPSGHVCGMYAATDLGCGVQCPPANRELAWAQDLTDDVSADEQGVLNPQGINAIRSFPGRGIRIYGARTMSSDTAWMHVNVRRLVMMVAEALEKSVQWAVFEPNNMELRETLRMSISSFLSALWERGALAGGSAAEAFFVQCDDITNPSYVTDAGQLVALVGVAPVRPAEFVVIRVGRTETTEVGA